MLKHNLRLNRDRLYIIAYRGALLLLLGVAPLLIWMLADAGLPTTIFQMREVAAGSKIASLIQANLDNSPEHPIRGLFVVGIVALWGVMLFFNPQTHRIDGERRHRRAPLLSNSTVYLLASHGLVLATVFACTSSIMEAGRYIRARGVAARWNPVSQALFSEWPDRVQRLDVVGRVAPHPKRKNVLFVLDDRHHGEFREGINYYIAKNPANDMLLLSISSYTLNGCGNVIVYLKDQHVVPDRKWLREMSINWSDSTRLQENAYLCATCAFSD